MNEKSILSKSEASVEKLEPQLNEQDIIFVKEGIIAFDKNNNVYVLNEQCRKTYEDILMKMSDKLRVIKSEIEGMFENCVEVNVTYHIKPKVLIDKE